MLKNIEEVTEKAKDYEDFYHELHEQQKDIDEYYELTFPAGVPKGYSQITPPTAREWVDAGVRTFMMDNPKVWMRARGVSDEDRKKDADCESLLNFWLSREIIAIKRNARKLLIRGESYIKLWPDDTFYGEDLSDEEKEKRLFIFPVILSTPDPINVFPSPAHNGLVPVDVVEQYKITVSEAKNICRRNGWKWETNKKDTALVKWIAYSDESVRCFLIDGEPILPQEVQDNWLKFCPYVHIDAGFGQTSYEGKPEYLYRSIIYPRKDFLKAETRIFSQNDAVCSRYAWTRMVIDGEQEDVDKLYGDTVINMNPDLPIRTSDKVKVTFLEGEQPPPGMFQHLSVVSAKAQSPVVLSGNNPTGVYSGEHAEVLTAEGKSNYKDAFKNMEEGLAIASGMVLKIIDKVLEYPVQVKDFSSFDSRGYREVGPKSIDGHYDCEVKLLAEAPEATMMKKTLGDNEQKSHIISHLTNLIKYHDMSMDEAMEEIGQVFAELAVDRDPQIMDALGRVAIERFGIEEAKAAIATEGRETANIPPTRTGAQMPEGSDMMPQRVSSEGMEQIPSPTETNISNGAV